VVAAIDIHHPQIGEKLVGHDVSILANVEDSRSIGGNLGILYILDIKYIKGSQGCVSLLRSSFVGRQKRDEEQ
jgi:hypothetical protein